MVGKKGVNGAVSLAVVSGHMKAIQLLSKTRSVEPKPPLNPSKPADVGTDKKKA